MDYGKFLFEKSKALKEQKKKQAADLAVFVIVACSLRLFIPDRSSATMAALLRASSRTVSKALGDQTRGYKVAVLGAAGGIGQPCGLLMKMVRRRSHPSSHSRNPRRGPMDDPPRSRRRN